MNAQLCAMNSQLAEMKTQSGLLKQQTELTRQQMEGTMSAIINLDGPQISFDYPSDTDVLLMHLVNQGHMISPEGHVSLRIDMAPFPKLAPVLKSQHDAVTIEQFNGWRKTYKIWNFTKQDQQFSTQKNTLIVNGMFDFDNGFGRIVKQDFCDIYIGNFRITNEDGSILAGGGFRRCEDAKETISHVLRRQGKSAGVH